MNIRECWESINQHLRGRSDCSSYYCSLYCSFHSHSLCLLAIHIHHQCLHHWTSSLDIMFYFGALFQSIDLNPELLFQILRHICKRLIYRDRNLPYWKCFPYNNLRLNLSHPHPRCCYPAQAHLIHFFQFYYLIFQSLYHLAH